MILFNITEGVSSNPGRGRQVVIKDYSSENGGIMGVKTDIV
jgi:hypothetical protein